MVSRAESGSGLPIRTCVGCRERAPKADLLRIVMVEGRCLADHRGQMPGRGAWLHPRTGCLTLALRRRAFPRAFRAGGPLDVSALEAQFAQGGPEIPSG